MATTKVCDTCENDLEGNKGLSIHLDAPVSWNLVGGDVPYSFDVCPECIPSVITGLKAVLPRARWKETGARS